MATRTAPRPKRRAKRQPPRASSRPPASPAAPAPVDAGAFLSQVTHHLRAPVAVSRTMLSLLSQGYVGRMDSQQGELVRRVEARMAYLQTLIDDLVDLATIRTGMGDAGGPTALDAVVRDVCARFEPAAREKGIDLALAGASGPVTVAAPSGPTELMVTHLLRNAVTYTTSGAVRVSIEQDGRFARLLVADDGIGIPAGDRTHVFDEFFRAANAKALEELGTGLGLPIVRAAACRAGATIELESAEGRGTTIAVLLPRAASPSRSTTRRRARAKETRRRWPRS
jgi:two-component system, OmpR family, phosphate regulon sensor histidine kinase PhoR